MLYPISLTPKTKQFATVITAEDGTPLRAFADQQGIWRYPVTLNDVSPLYIQALIHYEDRWFWQHIGVNPLALVRALIQNIKHQKIVSGGSTLTMQVARLISPYQRSISGKLKQIIIALQLEWFYSKTQILSYYLNHAPFGGTIEGVQAASYTYLGKSAAQLSYAEAALLTVLPQAPSRNRPDRYPERALIARNKVLNRLKKYGSAERVKQAMIEPIIVQHNKPPIIAPLLARRLKKYAVKQMPLKTTLDIDMQMGVETVVKEYVAQLPDKTSAAVLIVENSTLKVKTYVGSADFLDQQRFAHLDMVQAIRSPGSTLKPFLYGLAMDAGIIHSQSLLINAPLSFEGYKPQNFSRNFTGAVSVSQALTRSLNIPAVQVLHHLSPEFFVSQLKNAGLILRFHQQAKSNLSVILGGVGSNLETLVGIYTALANQGLAGKIRFFAKSPFNQRYLLSAESAWIIKDILSHQQNPTANALSWKTGTSYGHRDFWSIGVTPDYTVGVWIGRPDGTPLAGHYGAYTASPLLFSIVKKLPQKSTLKKPETVIKKTICWPLGGLETDTLAPLCHEKKSAWIINQNVPLTLPNHDNNQWQSNPMTVQINPKTGHTLNGDCDTKYSEEKQIALWPLAVEAWITPAYRRKSQLGVFDSSCDHPILYTANHISIEGLENKTKLRASGASKILPRIKLQAHGGQGKYYWFINGRLNYTAFEQQPVFHQFKAIGIYQITVMDETGHSDFVDIEVLG